MLGTKVQREEHLFLEILNFFKTHGRKVEGSPYAKNQLDMCSCFNIILACDTYRQTDPW